MVQLYHALLIQWSLYKYKCLWGAEDKSRGSSLQEEVHTHIHLDYIRVKILSCKKKKKVVTISTTDHIEWKTNLRKSINQ